MLNLEIFARILFSGIVFKNGHIYAIKNSRLGHDLPVSVNDRVISPYQESFIFVKIKHSQKCQNLLYVHGELIRSKLVKCSLMLN